MILFNVLVFKKNPSFCNFPFCILPSIIEKSFSWKQSCLHNNDFVKKKAIQEKFNLNFGLGDEAVGAEAIILGVV